MASSYHLLRKENNVWTYLCIALLETFPTRYKRCPIRVLLPASTWPIGVIKLLKHLYKVSLTIGVTNNNKVQLPLSIFDLLIILWNNINMLQTEKEGGKDVIYVHNIMEKCTWYFNLRFRLTDNVCLVDGTWEWWDSEIVGEGLRAGLQTGLQKGLSEGLGVPLG